MTTFPHKVVCEENVWIPLPDGTRLAARIWMPEGAPNAPVPAILEYLPYRKRDGTAARDTLTHPYLAGHGYAGVRVDIRGNGESDGLMTDEYSQQELDDALAVIDWLVAQDWCDGSIGMMGISWGGFNGLQVAALKPPALKAIITLCSTDDRFADDIHYSGGCLLNENLGWGSTMLSYSSRPPDPALVGDRWRELWRERLENQPLLIDTWLSHQTRDAYWKHGSVCEDFSSITAATLVVGGWGDAYSNAIPRLLDGLNCPRKGSIGPWVHKYPHFAVPEPRIGFLQEALRWWDRWLKGVDTGVENDPDLRAYMMDSVPPKTWYTERPGRWVTASTWPAPSQETETFYLSSGQLGRQPSGVNEPVKITSPETCGFDGGEYCAIWLGPDLPGDQRRDDDKSLVFDSAPLEDSIDILGAPTLALTISADQPFANVAVRLCDVRPDGTVARITHDVMNLRHRDGSAAPSPVVPGEAMSLTFQLDDIGYRVPAGHRLRVAISAAYWPLIWPTPAPVTLTVHLANARLDVPVCAGCTEDAPDDLFAPPQASAAQRLRIIREGGHQRILETDQANGAGTLRIVDDFGESEDLDTGLVTGEIAREVQSIHPDDPLCARMSTHWTQTRSRGDWSIRTEAYASIRSDAENFYVEARVEAFEGDEPFHTKTWNETVRRVHV
ncbi:MAG: CocE/NonD family hydrolase [Methyloligellaceae bacterium]